MNEDNLNNNSFHYYLKFCLNITQKSSLQQDNVIFHYLKSLKELLEFHVLSYVLKCTLKCT